MIELRHIRKEYGGKAVLSDLSLTIGDGEKVAVMGRSGTGKTTLLRLIAGLEKPDGGSIVRTPEDLVFSTVFADPRLFPTSDVLENVVCVTEGKEADVAACRELLRGLGLAEAQHLPVRALSTGMAQRVSLARALAYDAPFFLLDEPFRGLDKAGKAAATAFLKERLRDKSAFLITHDREETDALADRCFVLENGMLTPMES
ncbi:MAG: ATP-binding cassette domain-containing protein [Ruminococcus sp.]|nr:ATP-binding cassette domain-containing protein [Candidatus Apopatosoma intestinale]